jgi:glycosyltransferase involved in cell wall biosynthesis
MMLEDRCDVIHAHWTYEFALAALGTDIPTLVTIHDLPWRVLKYFRDPYRAARLVMAYQVARKGKFFSAVSPDAAKHYKQFLRPKGTIDVIPNYMPEPVFELGKAAKQQSDRPLVFATMLQGWSKRKNAECALVAYQQVRQSFPESRLMMFGADYEDEGAAHRWAAVRGLCDGVEFKGPTEYSRLLFLVAESVDVLVHPSLDEACSMTILECMALRKPVIAGIRTPGIRFELDEGRAGLLVDVRSPNAIATAMRRLASDALLRQSLADSAYEYARKTFTADAVVSQYEALYEKVLHNREGKLCY